MDILYKSCAGIDVHQSNIVVCVLHGSLTSTRPKREEARFDTTTSGLKDCHDFLSQFEVEVVGMESTGIYWKPVWHALCQDFELILANPAHMKAIPGHKTDKKDAFWIAKLTRIGLLPKSFVPDETIQELRELTRLRKYVVEDRTREVNRIHKILQSAGIKLSTYIEDIMGTSGRNLMKLLCDEAEINATSVRQAVYTSLKKKVPDLLKALDGYFSEHHRFRLKQALRIYDHYQEEIQLLEERIDSYLTQFQEEMEILDSIPGIDRLTASVFIAEVGTDMSQFPTAGHLASWAGLCPGNNESAGKKRSTRIRPGNAYLKRCLCQSVYAARRQKSSPIAQRFCQLKSRRGPQKATIAIAHHILKLAYYLLSTHQTYQQARQKEKGRLEAS
ncbi:IS110 family transposase [Streptococcus danieliae]|uniref:IS110 family transposase n=1 Tax=Streptococcus danieliae TaxID=747656 RepID=A0A7Z0M6J7_9STRE|nr:IS110 family transposase [Streptococcus danieliae]MBF0699557.1 IS110 family transposase [Streptococcus danieliae]NYS96733.1 IS110 family transposase [Streptococcus danieliae]